MLEFQNKSFNAINRSEASQLATNVHASIAWASSGRAADTS